MTDQGNNKEVYYFSGEFRCTVLQEYHISSTRKDENYRETSPKNAMDARIVVHGVLKCGFDGLKIAGNKVVTL